MKKKLLLVTLATTMVLSSILTGCGSNGGDATTITTPSKVESNDSIKDIVEDIVDDVVTTPTYNEKFYELDVEAIEEKYLDWDNFSEEEIKSFIEEDKLCYEAAKFAFEDMTRRFKNKETVECVDGVCSLEGNTFVCDVKNLTMEGVAPKGLDIPRFEKYYSTFGGFDAEKTEFNSFKLKMPNGERGWIPVNLFANKVEVDGYEVTPMCMNIEIYVNDDGTFSYKYFDFSFRNL